MKRKFGTTLTFRSSPNGGYWAIYRREPARPGGMTRTGAYIERRRSEPDRPAGWYYFGPGAPAGERAGDHVADAAKLAANRLGSS